MVDVFLSGVAQGYDAEHHVARVVWDLGFDACFARIIYPPEFFAVDVNAQKVVCLVFVPEILLRHVCECFAGVCCVCRVCGYGSGVRDDNLRVDVGSC